MKLLELMVQEKVQWPAGAMWAVQDEDKELKFSDSHNTPRVTLDGVWLRGLGRSELKCSYTTTLADDWDTKVVSKQEYDAAVAKEACASVGEDARSSDLQWYAMLAPVIAAAAEGKVVQYLAANGNWYDGSGAFCYPNKYRVKPEAPKTIKVNGFDVPEPMREAPADGASYFIAETSAATMERDYYYEFSWDATPTETCWLSRGILHSTKEAAVAHAKAMLGIDPYADVGADNEHT